MSQYFFSTSVDRYTFHLHYNEKNGKFWFNLIEFLFISDPCFQPVGITNGLVIDRQELVISRLSGTCNEIDLAFGEFYKSMTIKGIAIKGTSRITNQLKLPMDYAYIDANPWVRLNKSSRINAKEMNSFQVSKTSFFLCQYSLYLTNKIYSKLYSVWLINGAC